MESEKFISNVINSLDEYPHHLNEFDKQLDIQTFIYLLNEFDIGWYMDNLQITEEVFDTYFKDIVKEYDKSLYKSIKKSIDMSTLYHTYP